MASSVTNTGTATFPCPVCPSSFNRQEHLHRHLLTHSTERPFQCSLCQQSFKRRDALKRHLQTCRSRLEAKVDLPILSRHDRGKKRRACDHCWRLKRACDSCDPCQTCVKKNEECSYRRVEYQQRHSLPHNPLQLWPDPSSDTTPNRLPDEWQELGDNRFDENIRMLFAEDSQAVYPEADCEIEISQFSSPHDQPQVFDLNNPIAESSSASNECRNPELHLLSDCAISELARKFSIPFSFLNRFTQYRSLLDSFECGGLVERQEVMDRQISSEMNLYHGAINDTTWCDEIYSVIPVTDPALLNGQSCEEGFLNPITGFAGMTHSSCPGHIQMVSMSDTGTESHPAVRKKDLAHQSSSVCPQAVQTVDPGITTKIVQSIRDVMVSRVRGSRTKIQWSPIIEQSCYRFFSVPNLRRFLTLFWSCWYPNCPIIHKPTFAAEKRSPFLVASMALIGACLSTDPTDRKRATVWFDNVEELIFSEEILCEEFVISQHSGFWSDEPKTYEILDCLQAAYLICVLQNWEGSKESRIRIRRNRYNTVVAIVRDLRIGQATLEDLHLKYVSEFRWRDFVLLETLIRTATYVFLVDSAFVVFHHSPPRMMLPELQIDLACPEACFQAETAEECFLLLSYWAEARQNQPRLNVSKALKLLCHTNNDNLYLLKDLSILNLFTIVTALHSILFNFESSFAYLSETSPAETGLNRWMWLWNQSSTTEELRSRAYPSCEEMWKRVGFMQHAAEFCLLAHVMVECLKLKGLSGDGTLAPCSGGGRRKHSDMKFDESDMSQVAELIKEFQHLSFSQIQFPWL